MNCLRCFLGCFHSCHIRGLLLLVLCKDSLKLSRARHLKNFTVVRILEKLFEILLKIEHFIEAPSLQELYRTIIQDCLQNLKYTLT